MRARAGGWVADERRTPLVVPRLPGVSPPPSGQVTTPGLPQVVRRARGVRRRAAAPAPGGGML